MVSFSSAFQVHQQGSSWPPVLSTGTKSCDILGVVQCQQRGLCIFCSVGRNRKPCHFCAEASSISSGLSRKRAQAGDMITIDFCLKPEGDFVAEPLFDMHGEQTFVLGGGNYLPGLHALIEGMEEGESVSMVSIDAGWGERNPNLVSKLNKESFAAFDKIQVGTEVYMKTGLKCVVTEKTEDSFTIVCNPPLAGASYSCDLKLLRVDRGPDSSYPSSPSDKKYEVATFGLGCFWGGELAFMREPGVVGTKVGYSQGVVDNP